MSLKLTDQVIRAVRDAIDIVEVAGEHTSLTKRGRRHIGLCPFHQEKTPSFSVDPEQNLYYCFGCGAGGDALGLHMNLTGEDFATAIESLARRHGIPIERREGGSEEASDRAQRALEGALEFFKRELSKSPMALGYLRDRKVSSELIERYEVGYAPDSWRALTDELGRRIPTQELEAAGLIARSERAGGRLYDRFRNRLMFAIRSPSGRLVGFGGRTLGDDRAKYVNTAETEQFRKSRLLYGLDRARRQIRDANRVLLVEGYFDVIGAVASGVPWAVASMGTSLTVDQARLLARSADEVVVGYDGDRAGEEAARRAVPILLGAGLEVRRAAFPAGQDPDSLRLEEGAEAVREVVDGARDSVLLEIERISPSLERSPHEQAAEGRRIQELLGPIRDAMVRHGYLRMAADRLGMPVELLAKAPSSARPSSPPPPEPPDEGSSMGPPVEEEAPQPGRHAEERALQLLLAGRRPADGELPSAEIFFDPGCRAIFRVFCDLGAPTGPEGVSMIVEKLSLGGSRIDRLARLLLQDSESSSEGDLGDHLEILINRHLQQRLGANAREMRAAQQVGNQEEVLRLVQERELLQRRRFGLG